MLPLCPYEPPPAALNSYLELYQGLVKVHDTMSGLLETTRQLLEFGQGSRTTLPDEPVLATSPIVNFKERLDPGRLFTCAVCGGKPFRANHHQ